MLSFRSNVTKRGLTFAQATASSKNRFTQIKTACFFEKKQAAPFLQSDFRHGQGTPLQRIAMVCFLLEYSFEAMRPAHRFS
jgi:hypothetical protein